MQMIAMGASDTHEALELHQAMQLSMQDRDEAAEAAHALTQEVLSRVGGGASGADDSTVNAAVDPVNQLVQVRWRFVVRHFCACLLFCTTLDQDVLQRVVRQTSGDGAGVPAAAAAPLAIKPMTKAMQDAQLIKVCTWPFCQCLCSASIVFGC